MTIQIRVSCTAKSYGHGDGDQWTRFDERTHYVADDAALKEWLRETYGTCKRAPMFRDKKDGPPVRCGYVFGFRNADYSHSPVQRWLQQDWVTFNRIIPIEHPANL